MLRKTLIGAALLAGSSAALAQASLGDQINAVNAAVAQTRQAEADRQAARENDIRRQQLFQEQAATAERQRIEAQREAERQRIDKERARAQAERERAAQERRARQAREDSYEDQLRQLELKNRELTLQAKEQEVKRTNDQIDQRLKRQAAETDLIQSNADATRNVSQGVQSMLHDTGGAKLQQASGWLWYVITAVVCAAALLGVFIVSRRPGARRQASAGAPTP